MYLTPGGGGTRLWFGRGCAARASKPLPFSKGHFVQKRYPLQGFFTKYRPIFQNFRAFAMRTPKILENFDPNFDPNLLDLLAPSHFCPLPQMLMPPLLIESNKISWKSSKSESNIMS